MTQSKPQPRSQPRSQTSSRSGRHPAPPQPGPGDPPPLVSGRWLFSAFALSLVLALVCGYGALCLLFYQGQWQMLFHPSRKISATPAAAGLGYSDVRFDVTDTGLPRLDGWWIPASSPASSSSLNPAAGQPSLSLATPPPNYSGSTILYLHDAHGSLSDCIPALAALHSLGINVFAFDYRGFGRSVGTHPTERMGNDDSAAAWRYLTDTRHIPPRSIILYGAGAGATFAARLAVLFAPAGVILQDPNRPARQIFAHDGRARILPLFLLQKEHLDAARYVPHIHAPLLFLDRTPPAAASDDPTLTRQLFRLAPHPKQYYDLRNSSDSAWKGILRRFFDTTLSKTKDPDHASTPTDN